MWRVGLALALVLGSLLVAPNEPSLGERAREYLIELIRLDTTNPPGNETRAAEYLKRVAGQHGIEVETLGSDPARGATDGAFLRQKGKAVYGAPVFLKETGESRAHGNDERIAISNLERGAELLWKIVLAVAEEGQ